MGNTLYTSAMHGITPPSASELIEVIPSSSAPNTKTRHGRETSDAASGGQRSTSGSIGPNPFEKMFAYERSRPVTSHDAVRPQGQRRVSAEARSRPSTAASGVRTRAAITATSRHLPKHIACLTTPRRESKAALHTTLRGKDPSALAASQAQNNAEVRPSAHSFDWARETSNSKQEGMAKAVAALKQSELDKAMNECAQMAPLVRRHMLKKGDVLLLNTKFRELDKNGDRKIQWHEFEQGRSALPTSIQGPLQDLFLARRKGDVNFADFINVVGPVYLEFAALAHTEHHKNTRFHKPKHPWRMGQQ
eukprot:Tamp_07858.p1 GENE.Tamp_07858~~Tamp_07858.p1  ORF type:complete len:306 (-),score=37.47 Tamp_07858:435-1352(-)